jgi:SAM-dependent methyltransferase
MNSTRDYFDIWAKDYQESLDETPDYVNWSFNEVAQRIPRDKSYTIADLGTGNGRLMIALKRRDCSFIGVDLSPEQLKLAEENTRQHGLNARFICADLNREVPFETGSIDYFVSNAALHHVENKELLFKGLYSSLRFGGGLIFFDYYFHVVGEEYKKRIRRLIRKNALEAKRFRESVEQEYRLIPDYLKKAHPKEFHIDPEELRLLLEKIGFLDIELIPSFDERYIGFKGNKLK